MAKYDQFIVFLYTPNLPATAQFYESVLELPLALDQGNCRIYKVSETGYLGFCDRTNTSHQPEGVILTLVTSDVDIYYHRLLSLGAECTKTPTPNPKYGIYHCFFKDPNGYIIEIQRFNTPLDQ